jgi:hypothetical protein
MFHRRRSVDVGGLALALGEPSSGHGWGGWEETEQGETRLEYRIMAAITALTCFCYFLDMPK